MTVERRRDHYVRAKSRWNSVGIVFVPVSTWRCKSRRKGLTRCLAASTCPFALGLARVRSVRSVRRRVRSGPCPEDVRPRGSSGRKQRVGLGFTVERETRREKKAKASVAPAELDGQAKVTCCTT